MIEAVLYSNHNEYKGGGKYGTVFLYSHREAFLLRQSKCGGGDSDEDKTKNS